MKYPSLKFLNKLNVSALHTEEIAHHTYALTCCQYPASVVSGKWYQMVDDACIHKITELREEINRRIESEGKSDALVHALAVIDGTTDLVKDSDEWMYSSDLRQFSDKELIELHSMTKFWCNMRRNTGLEMLTRTYQWRIVNELLCRNESDPLAQILLLAEFIEADNYAHNLDLPYTIGEKVNTFSLSDYACVEDLRLHINVLSQKGDYVSREELIQIADYIQTEIVEKAETANHMELVNAILCTGMPSFDYPKIVKAFEQTIKSMAKSDDKKDIELAPYFHNLWNLTQKPNYLSRFEKTVRQCYLTLANNKHYPNLGVNKEDAASLSSALRFLDEYRMNVWIINEKYDVDKVIERYL